MSRKYEKGRGGDMRGEEGKGRDKEKGKAGFGIPSSSVDYSS